MGIGDLINNVHPRHIISTQPGVVGTVGEVVVKPRFRQSTPFMPWAYDPYWAGRRADKLGSNVQDGDSLSWVSNGGPARTFDSNFPGNRSFKHRYGIEHHDIPDLVDKSVEPVVAWQGDVSWRRKLAQPRIAKRTGQLFLVKPQGFSPTGPTRGGNYPVAVTAGGTEPAGGEPDMDSEEQQARTGAGVSKLGRQNQNRPNTLRPTDFSARFGRLGMIQEMQVN